MDIDPSRIAHVRKETKAELECWKSVSKPSSAHHIAANVELVRRDDKMKSWFWTGCAIVALALIIGAAFWVI